MTEQNPPIGPISAPSKEKYDNSIAWRMFKNTTKNLCMRDHLRSRNSCMCDYCGKQLPPGPDAISIHHLSYDRECAHPDWIADMKHTTVPSCGRCFDETPREFLQCASLLVAIHDGCHWIIHGRPTCKPKLRPKPPNNTFVVCPRGYLTNIKHYLKTRNIGFMRFRTNQIKNGEAPIDLSLVNAAFANAFGTTPLAGKSPILIICDIPQSEITDFVLKEYTHRESQ